MENEANAGWIGVDFDGTLAKQEGWNGGIPGAPVPAMVERVKAWLRDGKKVKIVTARVCPRDPEEATWHRRQVEIWCQENIGVKLEVTHGKDYQMVELWDDRAVRVIHNTGEPCCHGTSSMRFSMILRLE